MIWRMLSLLGILALLALVAFQFLVQNEVQRVMSVHVLDKAVHLMDRLKADEAQLEALAEGRPDTGSLKDFATMSGSLGVASVSVFNLEGTKTGRLTLGSTPEFRTAAGSIQLSDVVSHHGHDHDHGPHGVHDTHDHGHSVDDERGLAALDQIAALPTPSAGQLRSILDGTFAWSVFVDVIGQAEGEEINYASVLLPLETDEGERLGAAHFLINVSHIYATYADGVATFGMLFMFCGVILFGVPAFAFWYQKRVAERSSEEAKFLSRHDVLTGLLNRTVFSMLARTQLDEGRIGYAAYIDVDRFKQINDNHGHAIGDAFLKRVADLFRMAFGDDALIARLGGDEFGVILPDLPKERAEALWTNVIDMASKDHDFDGVTLSITLSVGIAVPQPGDSLKELLQRADTALYFAKSNGRNRVCYYEEAMGTAARRRRFIETLLRDAVRKEGFELHYQPLVDAKTFETVGYEALLRLSEPDSTPIPPLEFVPIAEEIGLIEEIGTWVLNKATHDMSQLDGFSGVSVNLSAEQFQSGHLVRKVRTALERSGLSPERLELEVTESLVLDEDSGASYQIDALREMGVRIAMDDFGTGFSSLSTLWRYGFDRIKIDKSFIAALKDTPERSRQLIDSIVLLGERMGMKVTAEGIETEEQKAVLVNLGCDVLQGYYFGRPAPLSDFGSRRDRDQAP